MGFTEAGLLARLFSLEELWGLNSEGFSTTLGLSTFGGFSLLLYPLVGGGTFFIAPPHPSQLFGFLERWSVAQLLCPPGTVNALLSQEPGPRIGQWRPKILRIGGSMSSQTLRRRARALADRVYFAYGSTEVGLVASAYAEEIEHLPTAVGRIIESVEVGIVDDEGNAVPAGEDGIIRVKAPAAIAVRAYLGPNSQSAQWFKGEWFYPGDRGSITPDGILSVSGRMNDVINLGGNKVSAESIDDMLSGIPGVVEIAAVGLPGPGGFHDLCVAVVSDKPMESRQFNEVLAARRLPYRVQRTANVEALPRNEMRKVVRRQVVALFK
jgi:acyl-coenzyme A synthetase/AMP-(fatty) acid ligase